MAFAKIQEKNKSELDLSAKNMEHLVTPIKQTLSTVGEQLNALEKSRIGAYEALQHQVKDLLHSQNLLKNETTQLVSALKAPASRGRWGEIQLRRVVELAGMIKHCDFDEQVSVTNDDKKVRPDMIIHYPGGKQVIVDSKVPLTAYLKSLEVSDENEKKSLLAEHARQVRAHVVDLARKEYWTYITPSPEFVVMFLPGETFLSLALEQDPTLIEFAMKEHVIITTPTTFLALLHTVACGWKQNDMETNAQAIIKMGQELYDRLRKI
ncbi:MAG: DNA recombination protein RmuC, partial [Alphaproteobacteria bacterium]|nr:DNA recombination protein RmuC [Alphaproteobacteria bacterium]